MAVLHACGGGGDAPQNPGPPPGSEPPATSPPSTPNAGLDARPANATCTAWPRPSAGSDISLSRFTNLSFTQPVALLQAPGDNSRWFVVQQNGNVRQFSGTNPATASNYIDISSVSSPVLEGGEMGLLGMAFHPNYPADHRVFLSFTTGTGDEMTSRISAFTSSDGGATLDPATESIVLTVDQVHDNHNGGHIAFGPDGYLYIGMGDGGGGGDPTGDRGKGQLLTTMLGKMLRIDVNGAGPYTIPPSNPSRAMRHALPPDAPAASARRSTPMASAIHGAGTSIASTAICGWPMWASPNGKKLTW